MKFSVKMPRVAETTDEVVIEEWAVEIGADIAEGDVLVRVETDKAIVEVPSPVGGTLIEQLVAEGEDVLTGSAIAIIEARTETSRRT